MTRIQPECFIEQYSQLKSPIQPIENLEFELARTRRLEYIRTIALFLIKPQSTTLAERLEARKVNNHLKH